MVDEVTSDGQVMIHFVGFKTAEVTRLALLREPLPEEPEKEEGAESSRSVTGGRFRRSGGEGEKAQVWGGGEQCWNWIFSSKPGERNCLQVESES